MMQNEKNEYLRERYSLAMERVGAIPEEKTAAAPFCDYFRKTAGFLLEMQRLWEMQESGALQKLSLAELQELNYSLYQDILPEQYETSYGNPSYAVKVLGEVHGKILSFLYTELRGMIVYAFEQKLEESVILLELFIEIYNRFEQEEFPQYKDIQQIIYWFVSDYSELFVTERVRELIDPECDFAVRIIMESDLSDLRYLYLFGEYISDNERKTAEFLNSLPEETIAAMADTYTEGYRLGFVAGGKNLSKKKTVNIRYVLGFERMIRKAIENFREMGLQPTIYRAAVSTVNKRQHLRIGYTGAVPNKQFDYDHRADSAIYMDRKFAERKLGVMRTAYENQKELAAAHGGPAVVEVFGERPFVPETKESCYSLTEKQQKITVETANEAAQITNQYIIGKERSFTIIAFPVPEIGSDYEKILADTIKLNTLDYHLYQTIQQTMIDALDQGKAVHIKGANGNCTDLTVALWDLKDPQKETLFENCVADVNIPVGEVFTSPKLTGTNGILHVTQVYLGDLNYKDLILELTDGKITSYSCQNFDSEDENKKFIEENLLFHHETLPIGEFAIGTNTTAYVMAKNYQIEEKMPILIAEKMGPHFAMGDTCYSWEEDNPVYNQNGKEIIARDNEVSLLRKEDPSKAYFGCHTDITIPYDELGLIEIICRNGERIELIRDGRFVLEGTQKLNAPLDKGV